MRAELAIPSIGPQ